jgi:hypothetical protein
MRKGGPPALDPNRAKLAEDPSRAVAKLLMNLLGSCAHCQSGLVGHEYALLASSVITNEKDSALVKFFEAIKEHRWEELREFHMWLGRADDVEVYVVRCSRHKLIVAVVKTHSELFQGSKLLYSEALVTEESNKLLDAFTGLRWHAI